MTSLPGIPWPMHQCLQHFGRFSVSTKGSLGSLSDWKLSKIWSTTWTMLWTVARIFSCHILRLLSLTPVLIQALMIGPVSGKQIRKDNHLDNCKTCLMLIKMFFSSDSVLQNRNWLHSSIIPLFCSGWRYAPHLPATARITSDKNAAVSFWTWTIVKQWYHLPSSRWQQSFRDCTSCSTASFNQGTKSPKIPVNWNGCNYY